jgi:hypothetical protein
MTAALPIARAAPLLGATGWRAHLTVLGFVAATILVLFHRDAADMVGLWLKSETFNHCALILPIIGWLVWQRLAELRRLARPHGGRACCSSRLARLHGCSAKLAA